ncbi:sensor domain-containing diguanylate cyclase [Vreelandella neptunia]|uniref:diguanylate cyclase n=1 Tax=Vreelandella neptunia TaxID=115551 RepID=A0ABS9S947_9GAMM|nr:sensor domain-containing diguanylate cyclase [Halomonas neptunia]MCH4812638.1 sensor domain-containing diguanylate cyclase [Halomonas neptunia]
MASRHSILFPSPSASQVFAKHLTQDEWLAYTRTLQKLHKVGRLGYWQMSLATGDVYWSEVVYEFLDVDPRYFAPSHEAFMTMVHPLDQDKVAQSRQEMLKIGFTDIKYRIIQPNGCIRWLHEIADNTSPDDPNILLGTLHDITAHKALEEKLRKQAITDDLTGVFNRRYFMKRLRQAFSHFRRSEKNVAVLLFDVDYFKTVNDTYGHAIGDQVLQQVCRLFKERFRETDIIGRLGGEEFAVLLFEVSSEDAVAIADGIRQALADHPFTTEAGGTFHISITCGVSSFAADDPTEDCILHRADKSLYLGKRQGRDQVVYR